jgi:hypothetical protein
MIQQFDAPFVVEQHHGIDSRIQHRLKLAFQPMRALLLGL